MKYIITRIYKCLLHMKYDFTILLFASFVGKYIELNKLIYLC